MKRISCFLLLLSSCYQRYLISETPPPFELSSSVSLPLAVTYNGKVLKNRALIASLVDERGRKYLDAFGQPLLNDTLSEENNLFYYSFLWDIFPLNEERELLEKGLCATSCFIDLSDSIEGFPVSALRFRADNGLPSERYRLVLRIGDGSVLNQELLRFSQEFELLPLLELPQNSKLTLDGLLNSKLELDPNRAIALSQNIPLNSHAITVVLPSTPSASNSKLIFNNIRLVTSFEYDRIKILPVKFPGAYNSEVFENNDLQTPVPETQQDDAVVVFEDDPSSATVPANREAKIELQIEDRYGQIYLLSVTLKGQT